MGRLSTALTDQARTVRMEPTGPRVEGSTPLTSLASDWMPARLVPADAPEVEDQGGVTVVRQRGDVIPPRSQHESLRPADEHRPPVRFSCAATPTR